MGESFELDGCWESTAAIGSEESTILVESGVGQAALYFYIGEQLYFATFEVTVTIGNSPSDDSSSSGSDDVVVYSVSMECEPDKELYQAYNIDAPESCSELDFLMSCAVSAAFQPELTCTTEATAWSGVALVWKKTS